MQMEGTKMINNNLVSSWIKRFLVEHITTTRNLSRNTQQSYRDTFRMFLLFVARNIYKKIDQLIIQDFSKNIIEAFLLDLENSRQCSFSTRNQRLAAIRAFAKFVGLYSPEYLEWYGQIRSIPFKKAQKSLITYLEKTEMDALLAAPNRAMPLGQRDYALLLFLYNTGTRADEVAQLKIKDLEIAVIPDRDFSSVLIKGKGNKLRRCPLWKNTVKVLLPLIQDRKNDDSVFLNRCSEPMTRFGIHGMVRRYVNQIIPKMPLLKKKKISPHTIRHTTATHLLRAGVDINTIRAWLGHVSINTTNIYAEVDLEMKAKALAYCEIQGIKKVKHWKKDDKLMSFLESL
jgi:integrase/recombinase XerD